MGRGSDEATARVQTRCELGLPFATLVIIIPLLIYRRGYDLQN